jgi:hypothetical protein
MSTSHTVAASTNSVSAMADGEPYYLAISLQTTARPASPKGIENRLGGVRANDLIATPNG